ncbi:hypothetical protein RhiirC2_793755 [Rhizophagus irregularis]|uniref:Uncharacterized protein n=1 Tax=Rhizophagus irregularis TaxID=588596 RepID=A0A2N1MEU2_9GLOM|nr:hypothetical protein RhiirC2_793755 [Rhizophagus irregularis]
MSSKSSKSIKSNNPLSAFAPKTLSSSSKEISSVTLKDSASNVQDNIRVVISTRIHSLISNKSKNSTSIPSYDINLEDSNLIVLGIINGSSSKNDSSSEIEHHKRKSINTLQIKASRLSKKDAETLSKALYYSKKAYKKALLAKESSVYTENTINEFIKLQSSCNESNENSNGKSKGHTKKKQFWYSQTVTNVCLKLFFLKKDPSGEIMYEFIHNNLKKAHPENVSKIENNTAGEWKKFWREARNKFRTRHANYVKNIKSAISNTFGKVFLREIPGQKTSFDEITNWKIQQIQVFKEEKFTTNNCLFVIAVVDLIFDVNVQVITLSGETITKRIEKLNNNKKKQEEQEDNDQEGESDD